MNRDVFIEEIRARLRGLKPVRFDTAVETDLFEKYIWEKAQKNPEVGWLIDEFTSKHSYGEEAMHDVTQLLYQHNPKIRPAKQMSNETLRNHIVVNALNSAPDFAGLREMTANDEYATQAALTDIAPIIHKIYDSIKEEEAPPDPPAGNPEGEEGEPNPEGAGQTPSAAGDLPSDESDFSGMSDEQLQDLMDQIAAAEEGLENVRSEVESEASQDENELKKALANAVEDAKDKLDEEEEAFKTWGFGPGDLQKMDFETRRKYSEALNKGKLEEFRKMLGRFKLAAKKSRKAKMNDRPEEFHKATLGDSVNSLLPDEYALMAVEETEDDFWDRYADKRLIQKQFQGKDHLSDGAIIVLVDNSGSMSGDPERWAKAFALGLLDSAKAARRDFIAINFAGSNYQEVYRFKGDAREKLDLAIRFVEEFNCGGTDWEMPIDLALEVITNDFNEDGKAKADIVLITDDECYVSEEFLERIAAAKKKMGVRIFGVAVGTGTRAMSQFTDEAVKIGTFMDTDGVKSIFKAI
jgi:uncharacterized protein with von Willebrand factor type A (vWA) domain